MIRMPHRTLRASILVTSTQEVTDQVRDDLIQRLIERMGGSQDAAFGTILLDLPDTDTPDMKVNLLIHEWE